MIEILVTDVFADWYAGLDEADAENVTVDVDLLEHQGVNLGFPKSSQIKGSRYPLRELRVKSKGKQIRVLYIFDAERNAWLLLGAGRQKVSAFMHRWFPRPRSCGKAIWSSSKEISGGKV